MAVTCLLSNKCKESLANAQINFGSIGTGVGSPHSFKIILMNSSFTFAPATHSFLADISSSEIASGNGYTQSSKVIDTMTISVNGSNQLVITFPIVSWTATGNIGPSNGAIIYDDSTTGDIIVGYINFGAAQTAYNGGTFSIAQGTITIS